MKTTLSHTPLKGLSVITIDYFHDERGFFIEPWNKRDFKRAGLDVDFVQEGHSQSKQHVLRGLHYQDQTAPMGKLIRCTAGRIFDVAVDIRRTSPTFGQSFTIELTAANKLLVYVPSGFAHGFLTLSPTAEVQYKQTGYYNPLSEGTLFWNDPQLHISWSTKNPPILSDRDKKGMMMSEYIKHPAF